MTDADDKLSSLFREGPSTDRDEVFAGRVMVDVDRLRRRANALLILRLAAILALLAVAAVGLSRISVSLPDLSSVYGGAEAMGVPAPLFAMAVLLVAATQLRGLLGLIFRSAGARGR